MIEETEDGAPDGKGFRIRDVSHGYNWRVYTGSGRIIGGWEATEADAREAAIDRIRDLDE
jgi:hypothetical protein